MAEVKVAHSDQAANKTQPHARNLTFQTGCRRGAGTGLAFHHWREAILEKHFASLHSRGEPAELMAIRRRVQPDRREMCCGHCPGYSLEWVDVTVALVGGVDI